MTTRLAAWIVGALAVALALPMLASSVGGVALLLAVPVAVVASILTRRRAEAMRSATMPRGSCRLRRP